MTILETIAEYARKRVGEAQKTLPLSEVREHALLLGPGNGRSFYEAIARPSLSFICEVKKASPSKGLIDPDFAYREIAADYEAAGADALSVLTEPRWFLGSDAIFWEIRANAHLPMLRKDFVVDAYQLYEARCLGADCVLLICALLDEKTLQAHLHLCEDLGLAALVETHDADEIAMAVCAGARMLGVNNRNLHDFSVDLANASRLRDKIPANVLYVAESGVRTPEDVRLLANAGADAVLIGEALMRAPDKGQLLRQMREASR